MVQDDDYNNDNNYGHIYSNDKEYSEDESYDAFNCSWQINGMELYKIVE